MLSNHTVSVSYQLTRPDLESSFLPQYATDQAAGADLRAAIEEPITLEPGQRQAVPTGVRIALPIGVEAQVRPRSGLARHHGLTALNTPGTIDSDYRGEITVLLINHGTESYRIERGDRIAQLVISPILRAQFVFSEALGETERGEKGFGSTGTN